MQGVWQWVWPEKAPPPLLLRALRVLAGEGRRDGEGEGEEGRGREWELQRRQNWMHWKEKVCNLLTQHYGIKITITLISRIKIKTDLVLLLLGLV